MSEERPVPPCCHNSEVVLRQMVEELPVILWCVDPQLRVTCCLGDWLSAVNICPEDINGKTLFEIFGTGDEQHPPIAAHRHALAGESTFVEFGRLERTFHMYVAPRRGDDGQILGATGVGQDASDQKCTEDALRESEAKHRALVEGSLQGIVVIQNMRLVFANAAAAAIVGLTVDDLLNLSYEDFAAFVPPERQAFFFQRVKDRMAGNPVAPHHEHPFLKKNGEVFWLETFVSTMEYNGEPAVQIAFVDITDRKLTEEALRESEERYRALFEGAAEGILVANIQTRDFHYANPAFCKMLGYPEEEIKQMGVADIHPREALEHVFSQFDAQARGEIELAGDIPCLRKDGMTVYADVNTAKIMLKGQAYNVGFFTDVTQRRQAEEAIRKEQRLLRQLLNLQEQDRKLTAYEIHDGLAQQLAGAQMRLQSFAQQHQTDDGKMQILLDEALDLLSKSVDETRRLITGLRPPIIDEAGIVAGIEFLVHEHSKQDGPTIEFRHNVHFNRLAPPLETAAFRIVQEALTNACRYSQSKQIRIDMAANEGHICIEIRDWGIGFDLLRTKENRFGLQGVRERARLLGGQATIETVPGEGTRIAVELPLLEAGK